MSKKRHVESAIFTATFNLSCTCPTTVIFEIRKGGSLFIYSLASICCFTYRNLFQNGTNDMSKMFNTVNYILLKKTPNFVLFRSSDFVQISSAYQSGQLATFGKFAKSGNTFPLLKRFNPMMHCS